MNEASAANAIAAVRSRPGMFFTSATVHDLFVFLVGYCFALDTLFPERFPHGEELRAFSEWLRVRTGSPRHATWEAIIIAKMGVDDERAFQAFFTLWDEFMAASDASADRP